MREETKIPEVNIGSIIHSCGPDNYCVATIVSGIFTNFEEDGAIIVHVAFPAPGMPTVCNHMPIKYHKPKDKDDREVRTWHLIEECVGGCKRMENSRLVH